MDVQKTLVFALVMACSGYAFWMLVPAALRRAMAQQLLRLPHPIAVTPLLQRAARAGGGGCDCSGCDKVVGVKAPLATQVVQFHPRNPSAK
jgi:hypothetical protein